MVADAVGSDSYNLAKAQTDRLAKVPNAIVNGQRDGAWLSGLDTGKKDPSETLEALLPAQQDRNVLLRTIADKLGSPGATFVPKWLARRHPRGNLSLRLERRVVSRPGRRRSSYRSRGPRTPMAKFSSVPAAPPKTAPATVTTLGGDELPCKIRHLYAEQEVAILAEARAFAKQRGVDDPHPEDPLYLMGLMVSTLLRGYVDVDALPDHPEPFFDGGAEQILTTFDQDHIAYLWALQSAFQDTCSGQTRAMTDAEVLGHVHAIATAEPSDPAPFTPLRPLAQRQLLRAMAKLILTLMAVLETSANPRGAAAPGG
jgi:hypothetical protein